MAPLLGRNRRLLRHDLRRRSVAIPTDVPGTDAIFLVLRRMRFPLITLVTIFGISVMGLSLMPGQDDAGNPHYLSLFDAFYVISYTATTIGFGEIPYSFSYQQRMWVTFSIYLSVVGWAYSLGALLALFQDQGFREAIAIQRLGRKVKMMPEPFLIVAGYGQAGRAVCQALDDLGRRFVVIDNDHHRIDELAIDQHRVDVPGIDGDVDNPGLLGLAGLGHRHCEGVLAVAGDEANLAIVMEVHLLRPEVPVIARATDRTTAERMADFDPVAVINPYDRYGTYLVLALRHPSTFRLATWLMQVGGSSLPPHGPRRDQGRWVVVGDSRFSTEVCHDLRRAGLEVTEVNPADGHPDVSDAVGMVAGAESDIENLALAAHARLQNPDIFLSVRQRSMLQRSTLRAFAADSLFLPSELVAQEMLARVITPDYWEFIDHVLGQDDEWSSAVLARMVQRFGQKTPETIEVTIDEVDAPAVVNWLGRGGSLTLKQLIADPDDRTVPVEAMAVALSRGGLTTFLPDEDIELRDGDRMIVAGRHTGLDDLAQTLYYDHIVEYSATGQEVPSTWLFRRMHYARQRRRGTRPPVTRPED